MRLPSAPLRYNQGEESQFRHQLEQELGRGVTSIQLGGGLLYEEEGTGKLMYRGRSGTVTQLALP